MVAPAVIGAAAGLIGKGIDAFTSKMGADDAWKNQKKVLKNQVQWRVADSVAAGLHPLAALGMAPANVGGQWMGTDFGSMGQDIGRAVEAAASPMDKASSQMTRLAVERGTLENELLRTQIASQRMRMAQDATVGVSGNASTEKLAGLPGRLQVTDPNLGQRLENAYQEWGNLFIIPNVLNDAAKYLGLDGYLNNAPNPWEVGGRAGQAVRDWFLQDANGQVYK